MQQYTDPALDDSAADSPEETTPFESPALEPLQLLVSALEDGLDHPEAWPLLEQVAATDEVVEIQRLIYALRPIQADPLICKILDIVSAMLLLFTGNRESGLSILHRLGATEAHCPQVAGALFYAKRHGDEHKSADLSTRFCESPFVKFETLIDGTVAPCCSIWTQKRLGKLEEQSFEEIWNSADAQEMRESILDGSYRYCNKQRCTLIMEDQLPLREDVKDEYLKTVIAEGRTEITNRPSWLFLAHDLTCNLACPSCRGSILVADEDQERRFEVVERNVFHPLLSGKEMMTISVSGQGDPWSSPHYRSLLHYMANNDLNLRLMLHTNALLMSEQRWERFVGLEKYDPAVDVSIDACTPWVYESVRRPGKWDRLKTNLDFINRKRADGTFTEFHLNATIQVDNYHELGDLVSFSSDIGADSMRLYMIQNTGAHLSTQFSRKNVADETHPLHLAFLETLRDPRLASPQAHLYDVDIWRRRSLEAELPSDYLLDEQTRKGLEAALQPALENSDHQTVVALCAAGHARGWTDPAILRLEVRALEALGFADLAEYRQRHLAELEPDSLDIESNANDELRLIPIVTG